MADRIAFAMGLAQKAGKAVSGDFSVRSVLKNRKAKLLVVAADAAPNSKKDMYYLAELAKIPVLEISTRLELGRAMGKSQRTAVAITDENFAKMLQQ